MVGAIIMAHGDEQGLRLPPKIAPTQVVVVPIYRTDEEKETVMQYLLAACEPLLSVGIRLHIDKREGLTPGYKFHDWEMRGVPVRMEIGPRDVENQKAVLVRRDVADKKERKAIVERANLIPEVSRLLNEIQRNMLKQATEFRDANTHPAETYDAMKEIVQDGWALMYHCGTAECEDKIKEDTKASSRNFPLAENPEWNPKDKKCLVCGKPAEGKAIFARAY